MRNYGTPIEVYYYYNIGLDGDYTAKGCTINAPVFGETTNIFRCMGRFHWPPNRHRYDFLVAVGWHVAFPPATAMVHLR